MVNQIVENYDYAAVPAQELDAIRMKLSQLTSSLSKIKEDIGKPIGFQQWHSLNAKITLLLTQLSSLSRTLQHYEYTLNSLLIYPLPNFPTTAHESLLTTLLRKKNIPEVDEWIKDCKIETSSAQAQQERIREDDSLSKWCLSALKKERTKIFNADNQNEETNDYDMDIDSDFNANKPLKKDIFKILPPPFDVNNVMKYMYTGEIS
ncbi:hypothetical protein ACO0RG_002775 [Hanseniaspora osmophila]